MGKFFLFDADILIETQDRPVCSCHEKPLLYAMRHGIENRIEHLFSEREIDPSCQTEDEIIPSLLAHLHSVLDQAAR